MTVLVTGARGNIGRRVVARLHAAGQQVSAAARDRVAEGSDFGDAVKGVDAAFL